MKTRLKDCLASGKGVINGWLSIPNTFTAEIMAAQDFDSITIDLQHGLVDYQAALSMLQAMSASDATPVVRPPWLEPGIIMKLLDAGALGVICPMVNNRADAEQLVGMCRYVPDGFRSSGPTRAGMVYGADYHNRANETVITFAMIETEEALAKVDEIAETPGLTGLYIGPSDLSISLGHPPGLDRTEPEMLEAIEKIRRAAKGAGIKAGIHCLETDYAKQMLTQGFDLVTLANDVRLLSAAAGGAVKAMRG
ncbi:aldolase/citrate lyase family protein [Nisaea acidiphila]|uniref:Aldolase/citrate lyase family protein n=1 Tax=Nisaea acidiphila TaxID=1862145 RepID=A0A9J7AVF6_9PROT|nr:aldolase/citrate lyase family protein [Nisaea acidiphila]UUX50449.1 aldolase/citrate lyase family protein [Nisaea acidiphila]